MKLEISTSEEKSVIHVQSCCFVDINLSFFLIIAAIVFASSLYCCDPKFLLLWQCDITLLLTID